MGFPLRAAVPKLGCFIISALLSPQIAFFSFMPGARDWVGPQRTQPVTCRLSVQFGFDFLWSGEDGGGA